MIIEKNIVINNVIATLIRTGMLFHPKTGITKKKAEILVSTITKPSSFSIINAIYSVPNILNMAEDLVGKAQYNLKHPVTANQHNRTNSYKLWYYR